MKRFWMRALLCFALSAALLTGCALSPSSQPAESPTDPLTGQELVWPGQRPVAITIDNAAANTTQWGLSTASLVLEALTAQQQATRLCLVYPAVGAAPQVGPVSAGQDLYWRLLVGQQVLPVQRGGGQFDQNYLDYYSLRAVDALEVGTNAFSCETNWQNVPLWHTSGAALSGVLGSLNISPALTESRVTDTSSSSSDSENGTLLSVPNLLPMQENGKLPDADASDAMSVRVQFDAQNATGFTYDADSRTYRMLHADGTPQLDANNGQQADFDNLLILFSASTLRDDGVTRDYDLTMGGGVWLNEGHLWNITWTQGSETTFFLYDSNGRPLTLTVARQPAEGMTQGTELELTLTPQWSTRKTIFGEDEKAWLIGIGPLGSVRVEELGFSEALKTGLVQTWRLVDLTWQSFVKLAQRVVPADQVGGPIMIAQMVGQQAEQGLVGVLGLAALISINLAILNLLPVPVLDGGQMLFCLIEMIFRRPVPQKIQEWGMRVGMALLLSLMIFATFNDVTRIINTPDEAPAVEKTAP